MLSLSKKGNDVCFENMQTSLAIKLSFRIVIGELFINEVALEGTACLKTITCVIYSKKCIKFSDG